MAFFGGRYERVHGEFAPPVHDPCTVALLIDPTLDPLRATRSSRSRLQGRWTRGATVVRPPRARSGSRPTRGSRMELDAPRFWDLVLGAVERLGR